MSYKTEDEDFSQDEATDEEMRALLEAWKAPDAPRSLDRRVMAAYRKQMSAPLWKRALASSIRVPLPAAAAVVLLLLASGWLSLRSIRSLTPQVYYEPPQVKVVEVPVVHERMVTRTVYVEKKRDNTRTDRHARNQYLADLLSKAQDEEASGLYFTRADLSGFQPVQQMRIEVIKEAKTDGN